MYVRHSGRPRPGAFTLIELLVVVSIIALLISILLPSLAEAREAGKRTVCLTNLRQIGTAMGSYFNEYSDIFPWFATLEYRENRRTNQSWSYGGRYPTIAVEPNKVAPNLRFLPEERPLNAYLYPNAMGKKADLKLFRCPSEDGVRWVSGIGQPVTYDPRLAYLTTGVSYTGNWWWSVLSGVKNSRTAGGSLGKLPDYANKMTRYKLQIQGAGIFGVAYGDPLDTMIAQSLRNPGWHRKQGYSEMLFLDGHADFLLTDTTKRPWYMQPTWTLWWNTINSPLFMPAQFLTPYPGIEDYRNNRPQMLKR
jgi:prepilin-type N-terminal cleavage/methylation domain-containing protein